MHHTRRFAVGLTCVMIAFVGACAAATAGTSHGVLSKTEYQELQALEAKAQSVSPNSLTSLRTGALACATAKGTTTLLEDEKIDCLGAFDYTITALEAEAAAKSCNADSNMVRRMNCLLPAYTTFYKAVEYLYQADVRVEREATARGFGKTCVAYLSATPKTIAAVNRLANDVKRFDNSLIAHNAKAMNAASSSMSGDASAVSSGGGSGSLSVCPHQ